MNKEDEFYLIVKVYRNGFRKIVTGGYMKKEEVERIVTQLSLNTNITVIETYVRENLYYKAPERINDYE